MLPPWLVPAGRAILALVLGLAITFTGGHTPAFGLVAFGVYAVAAGLFLIIAWVGPRAPVAARVAYRAQGAVTLGAGIIALVQPGGGMAYLVWVLSGWAVIAGALELVSGLRQRGRAAGWGDAVAVGALTLVLGVVTLLLPPDIADAFAGDKGVEGLLTSSIIIVGLLGAWAILTGVLQAISAASPTFARRASTEAAS